MKAEIPEKHDTDKEIDYDHLIECKFLTKEQVECIKKCVEVGIHPQYSVDYNINHRVFSLELTYSKTIY